jgi:hypothetical protein
LFTQTEKSARQRFASWLPQIRFIVGVMLARVDGDNEAARLTYRRYFKNIFFKHFFFTNVAPENGCGSAAPIRRV